MRTRENDGTEREAQGVDVKSTKAIFNLAEVSFFWPKSVFRDVRMQSCLALRLLVTLRPPLHDILLFFQTSDRGWPTCGRLGRQTSARTKTSTCLKITFVQMTYPKGFTGSLPLCPHIFSWFSRTLMELFSARQLTVMQTVTAADGKRQIAVDSG